ncbi:MAG: hypothetical protein RLZZ07_837, partial [Actinomycetota bacterium]
MISERDITTTIIVDGFLDDDILAIESIL